MLNNIWSCLEPNGYYLVFSYGAPEDRINYLQEKDLVLDIKVKCVKKPSLKVALEGGEQDLDIKDYEEGTDPGDCHFVYICKKITTGGTS